MMYIKLVSNLFAEAFGPQLHSKVALKVVMLKHIGLETPGRINKVEVRVIQAIYLVIEKRTCLSPGKM